MIKVNHIQHLIKLGILSGFVEKEQPISIILVSDPEAGKTKILSSFSKMTNVAYLTDATAYGIYRDILPKIKEEKITTIIIPDLLKPLSRMESTVKNLITFFNALIEEGVVDMSIYYKAFESSETEKIALRCGLITAITKDELFDMRHRWLKLGFMSRVMPVSYAYSKLTQQQIMEFIMHEEHLKDNGSLFKLPKKKHKIKLPYDIAQKMSMYTYQLSNVKNVYGFRLQRQFQALLKASALEDNRRKVTEKDLKKIAPMMEYINLEFKII